MMQMIGRQTLVITYGTPAIGRASVAVCANLRPCIRLLDENIIIFCGLC